jgi:hypothetical protein
MTRIFGFLEGVVSWAKSNPLATRESPKKTTQKLLVRKERNGSIVFMA